MVKILFCEASMAFRLGDRAMDFAKGEGVATLQLFPENGLHPSYHAVITDNALRASKDIVIATNSEMVLLRAMRRIRNGHIKNTDVEVWQLCKHKNRDSEEGYFTQIDICEEGDFIDHISGGFFEEGFNERFDGNDLEKL